MLVTRVEAYHSMRNVSAWAYICALIIPVCGEGPSASLFNAFHVGTVKSLPLSAFWGRDVGHGEDTLSLSVGVGTAPCRVMRAKRDRLSDSELILCVFVCSCSS